MNKLYLGVDVGTMYIKGAIIDEYDNIISSYYNQIHGSAIDSTKKMLKKISSDIDFEHNSIVSVGVTGVSKKIVGSFLDAQVIKNEVSALSSAVYRLMPNVSTIIDIGDMNAMIICIHDGVVYDYAISNSCGMCFGNIITTFAKNMNIDISSVSNLALQSKSRINIGSKCMVFSLNDLAIKVQNGYSVEDALAGLCYSVAKGFINNVAKDKKIKESIMFTGGVSKNMAVHKYLEEMLSCNIIIDNNSDIMGAIGIAIMARNSGIEKVFRFDICDSVINTKLVNCMNCSNKCDIITVYKDDSLIDMWGNKCNDISKIKNV